MATLFLIPLAGAFAHAALAVVLIREKGPAERWLGILSGLLAWTGLGFAVMAVTDDRGVAESAFLLLRIGLFAVPAAFVRFAFAAAGLPAPRAVWALFGWVAVLLVALAVDAALGTRWLIESMDRYAFGFYPRAGVGARFLFLPYLIGCAVFGTFRLLVPSNVAVHSESRRAGLLFVVWWLGIGFNLGTLLGIGVPPLGFSVDALLFTAIAGLFLRRIPAGRARLFGFRAAKAAVALAVGLLAMWLAQQVLPATELRASLIGIITAAAAVATLQWGLSGTPEEKRDTRPLFTRLQVDFGLTYQQARICCELADGRSRTEVRKRLAIADGTLRNHLQEIYSALLDEDEPSRGAKDRLQRLTVKLHYISR